MNEADELGVQGRKVKKDEDLEVTFSSEFNYFSNLFFVLYICMYGLF